jgi:hypothetical protein
MADSILVALSGAAAVKPICRPICRTCSGSSRVVAEDFNSGAARSLGDEAAAHPGSRERIFGTK